MVITVERFCSVLSDFIVHEFKFFGGLVKPGVAACRIFLVLKRARGKSFWLSKSTETPYFEFNLTTFARIKNIRRADPKPRFQAWCCGAKARCFCHQYSYR